jgi:hypothetical protein
MFLTTFLAVFKAIAFLIFMFLTFLLGTIRIVFTAIVTIAIPLILVISLLPVFRRVANRLIDAFLGLMIAPLFSALGIVAGVAHLQTFVASSPDPIVEWFAALAVMGLVTFIPAMIVPMLGSVLHSVSSIVSNTIAASSIVGGAAATSLNIAAGTMSVLQRAGGASISGIHLARTAISNSFGISGNAANSIATHFSGNDVNSRR